MVGKITMKVSQMKGNRFDQEFKNNPFIFFWSCCSLLIAFLKLYMDLIKVVQFSVFGPIKVLFHVKVYSVKTVIALAIAIHDAGVGIEMFIIIFRNAMVTKWI